jgi:AraC family transcriptional regulator, positive regulator of tynA and feaB
MMPEARKANGPAEVVGARGALPPARCWSTEDVQPRDALSYWCDSIGQVMLELDIEAAGGEGFSAQLDQYSLGPATANFLRATSQSVARSRRCISRSNQEAFLLVHLREGEFEFARHGQATQVRAGDCLLMDSRERYEVRCPRPTRCLILHLPPRWLRGLLPNPEAVAGRVLRPDRGWSAALTAAIAALQPNELSRLALPPGVVAEQVVSLLALAGGPAVATSSSRPGQLSGRLHQALRDRYHEIGLTPAAIARQLGISARYLHYLFAKQSTTFGRELVRVRLERARDLLIDPRCADAPVGDIAARCGFAEASHFARCFRGTFGLAPSDYRRRSRRLDVSR